MQPALKRVRIQGVNLLIIGNGIAGSTVARLMRSGYPDVRITMISDETLYPYSRPALMYIFMGQLAQSHTELEERHIWKNGIELLQARIEHIDTANQIVSYSKSGQNSSIAYDRLVLATGSLPRRPGVPGETLKGVQGLYHLSDLSTLEDRLREKPGAAACVIGGGLIGVELAEMLASRRVPVTMLVRESSYWNSVLLPDESAIVSSEIQKHVEVRFNTVADRFVGDSINGLQAVITGNDDRLEVAVAGVTIGVQPNLSAIQSSSIQSDHGILIDRYFRTSSQNVYAIGDCAEFRDGARIEQLWYSARYHAESLVSQWIAELHNGSPVEYAPEPYFNSAKFFSLEYLTIGKVAHGPSLLYRNSNRLLRICFDHSDRMIGINTIGIRIRQSTVDSWIREGISSGAALERLKELQFEAEFAVNLASLRRHFEEVVL